MAHNEQLFRTFVVDNFLFGKSDGLSDDTSFIAHRVIDSTGMLELIGFLGTEFGITLLDDEIVPENLDSIRQLTRFVERKLNGNHAEAGSCVQALSN
jgi:acyl carrier protein